MKTICNISRFIGEIFVFVGKFGLFCIFCFAYVINFLFLCISWSSGESRRPVYKTGDK